MIYLILSAGFKDNNPDQFEKRLKIGYTDNLENRLKAYLTTNPDIILLQTREGDTSLESYLHKKFEKYRYKDSREWFYYNQEIIDHFQDEVEDFIDEGILLEYIKKDLRSKIASVPELRNKYLDQILNEIKSLDEFDEELYDEEAITRVILDAWILVINLFNKAIDNIELVNYQPIDLLKIDNPEITVDITLDLPQILGRQRLLENPWKNRATLYFKSLSKAKVMTIEDFKKYVDWKRRKTEDLLLSYNSSPTAASKHTLAEKYQRSAKLENYKNDYIAVNTHAGKDLLPVINNLVLVSEIRAFQIQQIDYKDRFMVFRTLDKEINYTKDNAKVVDFIQEFDSISQFPDKMRLLCTTFTEEEIEEVLELVPIVYKNYYLTLGRNKIKALGYKKYLLDKEFEKRKSKQDNSNKISDLIYSKLSIGNKYLKSEAKTLLSEIYKLLGINDSPKASDLEKYFELKEVNMVDPSTGKRVKGYELLKKKE